MGNVNNQFKELINEAIHNHFHDKTEMEMILKDWLYGICEQLDKYEAKAKAFDEIMKVFENNFGAADSLAMLRVFTEVENAYIESGEPNA